MKALMNQLHLYMKITHPLYQKITCQIIQKLQLGSNRSTNGKSETLLFLKLLFITSHIFPENFNEIPQVDRKIGLKIFFANIIYFRQFFGFFHAN